MTIDFQEEQKPNQLHRTLEQQLQNGREKYLEIDDKMYQAGFQSGFSTAEAILKPAIIYYATKILFYATKILIHPLHNNYINMTNLHQAAACKKVLKDLRSNEAYVDTHVNFLAIFMHNGDWCSIILVWVPQFNNHVEQYACLCFIRSTIIALDKPSEYLYYYGQYIMIYPLTVRQVMVFEYDTNHGGYNVLDISCKQSKTYSPLEIEEVRTVVPQSYSDIRNLKIILNPIFHELESYGWNNGNVLNQGKINISAMCIMMYKRAKYIQEIYVPLQLEEIPRNIERLITILVTENNEVKITSVFAYTCIGYIPGTQTTTAKYKIAAGPNDTSVFLLREIVCPNIVYVFPNNFPAGDMKYSEIIELIEYLSSDSVRNFYKGIRLFKRH